MGDPSGSETYFEQVVRHKPRQPVSRFEECSVLPFPSVAHVHDGV